MVFELIMQAIWLMLPGIIANMTPVLSKNSFTFLAVPIDFNKKLNKNPILGKNKTWRGFILGMITAVLTAYLQSYLYQFQAIKNISLIDYGALSMLSLGLLLGFGVLVGDMVESFVKRRLRMKPSQPFIPWDQIDSALGGLLTLSIIYIPPGKIIIASITLAFVISLLSTKVGYWLGLRKENW
jgi:CDP-2,3-bis-(O-geranylgeranyl)-sn-glycerol synthase